MVRWYVAGDGSWAQLVARLLGGHAWPADGRSCWLGFHIARSAACFSLHCNARCWLRCYLPAVHDILQRPQPVLVAWYGDE